MTAWLKRMRAAHRRAMVRHTIRATERDLHLTAREIADRLETKRELALHLTQLKCELNSL